jgi:competence ComEA-like helix-hairpin-helix protein
MATVTRLLRSLARALVQALAPAEGEGWLIGLVVLLLLLGAVRHRVEPWLRGISAAPVSQLTLAQSDTAATSSDFSLLAAGVPERAIDALESVDPSRFGRVDLNQASLEELESLPRIGPVLAGRIVTDRELHGPYASIEELERVSGIGPRTVQGLRDEAYVVPPLIRAESTP